MHHLTGPCTLKLALPGMSRVYGWGDELRVVAVLAVEPGTIVGELTLMVHLDNNPLPRK